MTEKISRYRSAVMGAAILWIVVYHSGLSFSFFPLLGKALNDIRANGFGGVDIFLFISGFGLYRSLAHNADPVAFYGRRLKRVLPAFCPVLIIWLALKLPAVPPEDWLRVILGNLTGTAFWIGPAPAFNWYMLALYAFYGIAPFFYRALERRSGIYWVLAGTLLMDVCFYGQWVMIAVTRFTIFALGMEAGRWAVQGRKIGRAFEVISCLLGLGSYILLLTLRAALPNALLWNGGFYWYPFIFIAPAMIFLLCRFFSWLEVHGRRVLRGFEIAGECSLEIYLIHVVAFDYLHVTSNWVWLLVYGIVVFSGYIYHHIIEDMGSLLSRERKRRIDENVCSGGGVWKPYIGFMRIAACFLVIVNHTNSQIFRERAPSETWLCSILYFFICKTAVPIFLFIMGALMLDREEPPKRLVMRIARILTVTAAGSVCYGFFYAQQKGEPFNIGEFLPKLLKGPATNAFWYLYLYLGLLCLLPILRRMAAALSKRQLEYVLFLSLGVLGVLPLIRIFFPEFRTYGYLTTALFSPYVGMVLLGHYIEQYVPNTKRSFWWGFCGFALLIAFQAAGTFLLYQRNPDSYMALDDRTLLTITGSSACLYICVRYVFTRYRPGPRLERIIHALSDLTFGAYLLGDMMIELSKPIHAVLREHCHVLIAMVLWEIIILIGCMCITAGLRLIPSLRKWL